MENKLRTAEQLRQAVALWLLRNDKSMICCEGNELGDRFMQEYRLPEISEVMEERTVDKDGSIIMVFSSSIVLPPDKSVSGKRCSFVILRYVRALYDDYGNIYREITLGYSF